MENDLAAKPVEGLVRDVDRSAGDLSSWTNISASTHGLPFLRRTRKPFPLLVILLSMVSMTIVSSSFDLKEQLSHMKMITFESVKAK